MTRILTSVLAMLALMILQAGSFASTDQTETRHRVALVIGNGAYQHTSTLKNAGNDARAVITMLRGLGFQVIEGHDLDKAGLEDKVKEFSRALETSDVGLFYYAGHGLQVDGVNYLVPVDAKVDREDDVDFELMPLRQLIKRMERKSSVNLVFLDACRNNPITRSLAQNMGTRSTAVGRGLARVNAGVGTLISFATQPGNVALDGDGENSPFTQAIVKHLPTPDLDVALMMRRVRRDVLEATDGQQVPWTNSSLTDGFTFLPRSQPSRDAETEVQPPSRFQEVATAYQSAQDIGTCKAYEAFEAAYPETMFTALSTEWRKTNCGPKDPRKLALSLQTELKRVGCDPGAIDGQWGGRSRSALNDFARYAKVDLETREPSLDVLKVLRSHDGAVCPKRAAPQVTTPAKSKVRTTGSDVNNDGRATSFSKTRAACMRGNVSACDLGCSVGYQPACEFAKILRGG